MISAARKWSRNVSDSPLSKPVVVYFLAKVGNAGSEDPANFGLQSKGSDRVHTVQTSGGAFVIYLNEHIRGARLAITVRCWLGAPYLERELQSYHAV